jgi:disulfide bond formation protein DsbB
VSYVAVTRSLTTLTLLAGALGILLLVLLALPQGRARLARELRGWDGRLLWAAWVVAAVATGGSLYYSEVAGFLPCILCWYQRIAMYPLVFVVGVGAATGDARAWRYGLPLAVVGLAIAAYHIALQFRPALDVGLCAADIPCSARYIAAFGFVSIPVMAAAAFLLIAALLLTARIARDPGGD